jgi:hypothetical protein
MEAFGLEYRSGALYLQDLSRRARLASKRTKADLSRRAKADLSRKAKENSNLKKRKLLNLHKEKGKISGHSSPAKKYSASLRKSISKLIMEKKTDRELMS